METVDNRTFKQKVHDFTSKARVKVDTCVYNVKTVVRVHTIIQENHSLILRS